MKRNQSTLLAEGSIQSWEEVALAIIGAGILSVFANALYYTIT